MYDVQAMNANNAAYAEGALPDVIDLGADFSNAIDPNINYVVTLSVPATAVMTVTVNASKVEAMTDPVAVAVVRIPVGAKYGFAPLGTIPARYLGATAAGTFAGNIDAGLAYGVHSPLGVGMAQGR